MARPTGLEPASSTNQADTLERSLPSVSLGAGLILASSKPPVQVGRTRARSLVPRSSVFRTPPLTY